MGATPVASYLPFAGQAVSTLLDFADKDATATQQIYDEETRARQREFEAAQSQTSIERKRAQELAGIANRGGNRRGVAALAAGRDSIFDSQQDGVLAGLSTARAIGQGRLSEAKRRRLMQRKDFLFDTFSSAMGPSNK